MAGDRCGASLGTVSFVGDGVWLDILYELILHAQGLQLEVEDAQLLG